MSRQPPPGLRGAAFAAALALAMLTAGCDGVSQRVRSINVQPSGTVLLDAVTRGDAELFDRVISFDVHTEQRDRAGRTPLRVAIENERLDFAFRLIQAGADSEATCARGVSVLAAAVERDETALVHTLLQSGAKPDGTTSDGSRLLPFAIRHGKLAFLRAIRTNSLEPHLADHDGTPLIHLALASGNRGMVERLIALGAHPGMRDADGRTTIHLALAAGAADLVPALAAAGADPNASLPGGPTLLEAAIDRRDPDEIRLLLATGADPRHAPADRDGPPPLAAALQAGDIEILELLLETGNHTDKAEWLAWLEDAFQRNDMATGRMLARHCAGRRDGARLVEAAVRRGAPAWLSLFLNYGLPAGDALTLATASGRGDMVSLLLAHGHHPDRTAAPWRDTPVVRAVASGHDAVARRLLEAGAHPDAANSLGQSLFHLAVATGCPATVEHLIDHAAADVNEPYQQPVNDTFVGLCRPGVIRWCLRREGNITPLMVAADSGNIAVARALIAADAKRSVWTRGSRLWPVNFASRRSDVAMMRLILGRDPYHQRPRIVVTIATQRGSLLDENGESLMDFRVSTGRRGKATPTGTYVITNKHRTWTSTIFNVPMPYFQRLNCSAIGLHQGNCPGYPASAGCIRVPAGDAARIFALTTTGDVVVIQP